MRAWTFRIRTLPLLRRPHRPRPQGRPLEPPGPVRRMSSRSRGRPASPAGTRHSLPSLGLRTTSSVRPISVNARTMTITQMPGGNRYHHAPVDAAPAFVALSSMLPQGVAERVSKAEEGQRGLRQDDDRDRQRGVRDHQWHHVGEDVLGHLLRVAVAKHLGPLQVGTSLDAQGLRPDQTCRSGHDVTPRTRISYPDRVDRGPPRARRRAGGTESPGTSP